MKRTAIFLYFWILETLALRLGEIPAIIIVLAAFMIFYNLAEQIDEEDI